MSALLKKGELKKLLAAKTLKTEVIAVTALDGQEVEITELNAKQRFRLGSLLVKSVDKKGVVEMDMSRMGEVILMAAQYGLGLSDDEAHLLDAHGEAVEQIGQAVMHLSGMNDLTGAKGKNG